MKIEMVGTEAVVVGTVDGVKQVGQFKVVVVPAGAASPRNATFRPTSTEVEFYDTRFSHTAHGQFVSSYSLATVLGMLLVNRAGGLDLVGYEPAWKVTAAGLSQLRQALSALLDPWGQ